jgi:hypothetical protein
MWFFKSKQGPESARPDNQQQKAASPTPEVSLDKAMKSLKTVSELAEIVGTPTRGKPPKPQTAERQPDDQFNELASRFQKRQKELVETRLELKNVSQQIDSLLWDDQSEPNGSELDELNRQYRQLEKTLVRQVEDYVAAYKKLHHEKAVKRRDELAALTGRAP